MDNNLAPPDTWQPAMAAYAASLQPHRVEYLDAAGGFSGAQFWRLETSVGPLCLRRWPPEHPDAERLTLIHDVLRHAASRAIDFLPVPLPTQSGRTFLRHSGTLWELAPWLPGEGSFSRDPRPEKLRAALVALARFHATTADFPSPDRRVAPSPGIAARLEQLRDWTTSALTLLRTAVAWNPVSSTFRKSAHEIISHFEELAPRIERQLAAAASITTQLQPVIRDVWADHLLFTGDEVTGLVDFGGMNIDTPATDIARLLGSLASDDEAAWQTGLGAYERVRPLSPTERELIPIFDQSSVALSGLNWLSWIYLEGRRFTAVEAIAARLAAIEARMRTAMQA